jgi:hypothetical protein
MRKIGKFEFPDQPGNGEQWRPTVRRRQFGHRVLAVARTRIEGAWSAYIDAVPGQNHDEEQGRVLEWGAKLPKDVARNMFPEFDDLPYAG